MRVTLTLMLIKLDWVFAQVKQDYNKLDQLQRRIQEIQWKNQAPKLAYKLKDQLKPALRLPSTLNIEPYSGSILDYPKPEEYKKQKILELAWNEYYECLKTQFSIIGPDKVFPPQAIMIFEGNNLRLNCDLCISPKDMTDTVTWYYSPTMQGEQTTEIDEDTNIIISQYDNTLHIFNVEKSRSGLYQCHLKNTQSTTYFVHVVDQEPISLVRPSTAFGNHSSPPVKNVLYGITAWNDWTPWSKCNRCGKTGKKVRTGYCMVTMTDNLNFTEKSAFNTQSQKKTLEEILDDDQLSRNLIKRESVFNKIRMNEVLKIFDFTLQPGILNEYYKNIIHSNILNNQRFKLNKKLRKSKTLESNDQKMNAGNLQSEKTKNDTVTMLRIFDGGIPCRSMLLPDSIRNLPQVLTRPTEIMVSYCKEPCIDSVIFQAYDSKGILIEEVNNTAGIYSTLQELPPLQPTVVRKSITVKANYKNLKINCPGNIHENIPIEWQLKNKPLKSIRIEQETRGRIKIDLLDRIVFQSLKETDASAYSCWQNKELAGVVTLFIDQKLPFKLNRHLLLLGILPITITFTICLYRVFKVRHLGFA